MRLSISILAFAIFSSLVFAQNEDGPKNSHMMNIVEPEFKGINGIMGFQEFIDENLLTPSNAQNWGLEGAVVVRFEVFPTRTLSEIQIIHGVSPSFDEAVIEALEATNGMWNPGTINNRPVPMEKEVIVIFRIDETEMYHTAQKNKVRADDLLKEGYYSRAIKLYSRAIESCPNHEISIYRRGLAKYYSGDLEGAINDFERVADLNSHLADPLLTKLNEVADYAERELQLSSLIY